MIGYYSKVLRKIPIGSLGAVSLYNVLHVFHFSIVYDYPWLVRCSDGSGFHGRLQQP